MNFNQATIHSDKPVETVEFYRRLGLKLIVDSLPRYARLEFPNGDATISIHQTNEKFSASNIVLYFECEDLDATVEALKESGVRFESIRKTKAGCGAKVIYETQMETGFVFSMQARIAKIRRGVLNKIFNFYDYIQFSNL